MYASVSKCWIKNVQIQFNYKFERKVNGFRSSFYSSLSVSLLLYFSHFIFFFVFWIKFINITLGWSTFLPCINCAVLVGAMVPWAWLYRLLWCNYIKIISSLSGISYAKSAPLGAAWRRSAQVFVVDDIRSCLLYVSLYCIIDRSHSNSCTRGTTRSSNQHMSTNEMGICDAI